MSSNLDYLYCNNTLILQSSPPTLFCCTDATCSVSTLLSPVTSPLQPLLTTAHLHMYGCPNLPHMPHKAGCTNYIFQYINAKLTHTHTHSQLTAMATATAAANAAAMSPLQAAEHQFVSINTWPSSIIFSLFAETPSPRVIEYLTDFFSGNALPKTLAYTLYSACNPEAANEIVRQLFYT